MIILMNKVVTMHNKKTCMRLTNAEWNIVEKICLREHIKRKKLLELIGGNHCAAINFTAAVRLFTQIYLLACAQNLNILPDKKEDILNTTLDKLK